MNFRNTKPLSALFDAALLPLALAADAVTILPRRSWGDDGPSYTRQAIEKVEQDLGFGSGKEG